MTTTALVVAERHRQLSNHWASEEAGLAPRHSRHSAQASCDTVRLGSAGRKPGHVGQAGGRTARTLTLNVVVEAGEDQWHAYCPALRRHGAVTCGDTKEQAFKHIFEVIAMIVEELREEGAPIPQTSNDSAAGL